MSSRGLSGRACADPRLLRDSWQLPRAVIDSLGLRPNDTVADLGAGYGYFVPHVIERLGNRGELLLIEREPFASFLRTTFGADPRVSVLVQDVEALSLGREAAAILACNLVHQLSDPAAAFRSWSQCLCPGGRIVIVDFHGRDLPVGPPRSALIAEDSVDEALGDAGLRVDLRRHLAYQFLLRAVHSASVETTASIDPKAALDPGAGRDPKAALDPEAGMTPAAAIDPGAVRPQ